MSILPATVRFRSAGRFFCTIQIILAGVFSSNAICLGEAANSAPKVAATTTTAATTTNDSTGATSTPSTDQNTVLLNTYTVKASREGGVVTEGPQPVQTYDSAQISDSGAFSVQDFLDDLPPGEEGDEVLILIDGQPAHIDPASIPLDMIESVQVSLFGSIPELGAYAQGKVINIILKKTFVGGEIGQRIRAAAAGGGFQQNSKFSINVTRRNWSYFVGGGFTRTNQLLADARHYSREQDHTARGGSDLRLAWGTPAVVQAVSGNLNGLVDAAGNPVAVASALVPENQNGASLTPAQFTPGNPAISSGAASKQRRFNTSSYRMLIAPSTNFNINTAATYKRGERMRASISGNYSRTDTHRTSQPPVTAASAATLVPAAYNHFGQDVYIGLVHTEFGPMLQDSRTDNAQIGLKANGRIGELTTAPGQHSKAWNWNTSLGYQRVKTHTDATDLDREAFTAALTQADPELRFNPFGDPSTGPVNAHLYDDLTIYRMRDDINHYIRFNAGTNGPILLLPGGPLRFSLATNYFNHRRTRTDTHPTSNNPARTNQVIDGGAGSASLNIPLFGRTNTTPLLRRFEVQTSYWQNLQSDDSRRRSYAGGIVWSPMRGVLLRARHSTYENTPATTILPSESIATETFTDHARNDETVTDVTVFTRGSISAATSKNETETLGFTLEPPFARGLRFTVTHNVRQRHRIYQSGFSAQEIINNEASFPGRVIRDTPTPEDAALGLPGRITAIDTTPGNTGESKARDMNLSLEYRIPSQQYGRILLRAYATRTFESRYQVYPGLDYVYRSGGPPDWTFQGQASWSHKGWNTVMRVNYTGPRIIAPADGSDNISYTTVNFDLSYQFRNPIIGKFGKRLRVGVGVANCFDEEPIYADTISGYRGGSPLGRIYTCSFTLPI